MLIAVAVDERSPHAAVSEHLADAKCLLIVDPEQNQVTEVLEAADGGADLLFAKASAERDCEAIICGDIDKAAFDLLADNMITRYYGWGATASQAVRMMQERRLQLIRQSRQGDHCQGEEHWAELQRSADTLAAKQKPQP